MRCRAIVRRKRSSTGAVERIMDVVSNREAGNAWTAHILGELFDNWPKRIDLNYLDVSSKTRVQPRFDPEETFDDLLLWLRTEGFVTFEQETEMNAFGVALTKNGFAALGSQPEGLNQPLGTKLKEAASQTASEARGAAVSHLVGLAIGSALTVIKGG
jgi:hypothetical protein